MRLRAQGGCSWVAPGICSAHIDALKQIIDEHVFPQRCEGAKSDVQA
jgi:hypothetical protein